MNKNLIEQIVAVTLTHIHREYPNYLALGMNARLNGLSPSEIHPAFYGSLDWHSSVHSHWQLVRVLRVYPDAPFAAEAEAALERSLTAENLAGELAYFEQHPNYERPYGWAWFLQLSAETRHHPHPKANKWQATLKPLETFIANRFKAWLPELSFAVRNGVHSQTAFALGLVWDWATVVGDNAMKALLIERGMAWFSADKNTPLQYEPSGSDFLSASLGEADFMRRIMPSAEFSQWLATFMPQIPLDGGTDWLTPVVVSNPNDGQGAHFGGLNISRAWMLRGIAAAIPPTDARWASLLATASIHANAGLPYATRTEYMLSHWVPSFGIYLLTSSSAHSG